MTEPLLRLLLLAAQQPVLATPVVGSTGRVLAVSLGIVCAIIAIGLWGVSRSRWGQNKPLTNCIVLAVLSHIWLLMYAYGTRVVTHGVPGGNGSNAAFSTDSIEWLDVPTEPFDSMPEVPSDSLVAPSLMVTPPPLLAVASEAETEQSLEVASEAKTEQSDVTSDAPFAKKTTSDTLPNELATTSPDKTPDELSAEMIAELLPAVVASTESKDAPLVPQDVPSETFLAIGAQATPEASQGASHSSLSTHVVQQNKVTPKVEPTRRQDQQKVPDSYQLRFSESRLAAASQFGGDESTEASVESGLRWLALNQEPDGSWNAARHSAGRETRTMERDRAGTGSKADTAMTGLSLLAFLGAGYTHAEGTYKKQLDAGLRFLLNSQMPSGDLAGLKQVGNTSDVYYARMYSHGMAALALAEAYAMTGDRRLVESIQKALGYTLQAQNRRTGGWRYQAFSVDDPGDTSQFGWQAMALLSSQNGGFMLPIDTMPKMQGFISRVSVGRFGGLAVYRPIPGQQPSRAMTAEALALRLMLKQPTSPEAINEAKQFLLQELPGMGEENLYYWYYASIALFQLQDEAWPAWNQAMKSQILKTQITSGHDAGSWNPTCIWAGYGGRVYSTTMSCLCLEVYYRYLPIYRAQSFASSSQSELKR
ncbi:MAG: hypothetical protein NTW52_12060 [Planctomycetota bacterium]|nr:hypothetical protein [Planctomycetota bacterium]